MAGGMEPGTFGGLAVWFCGVAILTLAAVCSSAEPAVVGLEVSPREATLRGSDASLQIVVTGNDAQRRSIDLTRSVAYEVSAPGIVEVSSDGLVRPVGDGRVEVTVQAAGQCARVVLKVEDFANERPVWFPGEVVPVFTRLGCNNGGCHGKASGQNGFKLSLLGFEPRFDSESHVREGRGRRVFPAAPEQSLLLQKSTSKLPHGGGQPLLETSPEYRTLLRWIRQGMPYETGNEAKLTEIEVEPQARVLSRNAQQQLRVTAHYSDGSSADVTRLAQFQSNAVDLATVNERGLVQALDGVGVAAIMARYGGCVSVASATVPLGVPVPPWQPPESANLVDRFVFE
ncbi:MAG TPA: Ig-like domain-containing protein, partial [Isosphaeraceae bacterium]|nr:Ig-like domain-containing protein [Isosphaeraceae bacterium]